jgi:hypothetical protein
MHSGVNDTAVTLGLIFERLWLPLKGKSIYSGVIGTAVTKICVFIYVGFLRDFEATVYSKRL